MQKQQLQNVLRSVVIIWMFTLLFAITGCSSPPPPALPVVKTLTLVESRTERYGHYIEEYYAYAITGESLNREEFQSLCTAAKRLALQRNIGNEDQYYPRIYVFDRAEFAALGPRSESEWGLPNKQHVIASFRHGESIWRMHFYKPSMWDSSKLPEVVELYW